MPSIQEARPFIANYDEPNPFKTQADAAYRMYLDEVDSTQGWQRMLFSILTFRPQHVFRDIPYLHLRSLRKALQAGE